MHKIITPNKSAEGSDKILKNGYAKLVFQSLDSDVTERAWIQVKQTGPNYIGIFDNDPQHNIGVNFGDVVEFTSAQVIATLPPDATETDFQKAHIESLTNHPFTNGKPVVTFYDR